MDMDRVGLLLHVVDKLQGHPKLANIRAEALAELDEINSPSASMPEPVTLRNKDPKPNPSAEGKSEGRRV